ncbi:hypothetical protein FACS1894132_04660 [Clostridia bacterium]|nr:hypothetical protein FACS1894132_04660 [Clostridia bacterium]
MVNENQSDCSVCGALLKYYDRVLRIVRTKGRKTKWIDIRRLKCSKCNVLHRELPEYISPYKQYEAEVILGVLEGIITTDTLGYEDYPCEATMIRWKNTQNLQVVL